MSERNYLQVSFLNSVRIPFKNIVSTPPCHGNTFILCVNVLLYVWIFKIWMTFNIDIPGPTKVSAQPKSKKDIKPFTFKVKENVIATLMKFSLQVIWLNFSWEMVAQKHITYLGLPCLSTCDQVKRIDQCIHIIFTDQHMLT